MPMHDRFEYFEWEELCLMRPVLPRLVCVGCGRPQSRLDVVQPAMWEYPRRREALPPLLVCPECHPAFR